MNRISPTGDLAFKKVLASEENKEILSGLINDFFGIVAEELTILNPYSIDILRELKDDEDINTLRQTLLDITASFKTADFVSELQIKKTRYFDERSIYYPLKRFCENYGLQEKMEIGKDDKPNRYSSLRPVYALNILGYNHFEDDDSLRIFEPYDHVWNKRPDKELLRIGYFELTKTKIETTNQKYWHDYFNTGEVATEAPDYIKRASQIIDFANLTEEERNMSEALEKAQATLEAEIDYAFFEGADKKAIEVAMSFLQDGFPPEIVAKNTGVPLKRLYQLQPQR